MKFAAETVSVAWSVGAALGEISGEMMPDVYEDLYDASMATSTGRELMELGRHFYNDAVDALRSGDMDRYRSSVGAAESLNKQAGEWLSEGAEILRPYR